LTFTTLDLSHKVDYFVELSVVLYIDWHQHNFCRILYDTIQFYGQTCCRDICANF